MRISWQILVKKARIVNDSITQLQNNSMQKARDKQEASKRL